MQAAWGKTMHTNNTARKEILQIYYLVKTAASDAFSAWGQGGGDLETAKFRWLRLFATSLGINSWQAAITPLLPVMS